MILSEGAIQQAIRFTSEAKGSLERNYAHMQNSTAPYLAEWKDANVAIYMEQLESYNTVVKRCAEQMNFIEECLRGDLNFLAIYNNR